MSRRFFLDQILPSSGSYSLNQEEAADELHHLTRVLRLGPGDEVIFVNGRGLETKTKIIRAEKSTLALEILSQVHVAIDKPRVHVCQAALKGAKMDWLIEKLTELGVSNLSLLTTEFSVRQEESSRLDRWERIVKSAMKQSENPQLLMIHAPQSLEAFFSDGRWTNNPKILLHPEPSASGLLEALHSLIEKNTGQEDILLFLGPEGGFSEREAKFLKDQGLQVASLGKTILRGETAGIVAAATAIQAIAFWAH